MFEKICELLKKHMMEEVEITPETSIYDLGINSLDLATVLCDLEDEFDCEISEENLGDIETVNDMVEMIEVIKQ